MFQPLVRGVGAADANRSVGLGLFIVSEIVKAHGGTVSLSSEAEAGTLFVAEFAGLDPAGADPAAQGPAGKEPGA